MSLAARNNKTYPAIKGLTIEENQISAQMSDGRQVSIPIAWFPRLLAASKEQLKKFEISPGGYGIHWPEIDEDISVKSFLD